MKEYVFIINRYSSQTDSVETLSCYFVNLQTAEEKRYHLELTYPEYVFTLALKEF